MTLLHVCSYLQAETMSIKSTYVSSGANRASTCSAITPSGAIAFGADRAIATWSPSSTDRNVGTLPGHQANVTALKSCGGAGASALISGDAEGSARYWKEADGEVRTDYSGRPNLISRSAARQHGQHMQATQYRPLHP